MGCCVTTQSQIHVGSQPIHVASEMDEEITSFIDVTIYKNTSSKCDPAESGLISSCCHLQRLVMGLIQFDGLNNNNKQSFIQFMMDTYTNFMDDYIYFIENHTTNDQLLQIIDELNNIYKMSECDVIKCNKLKRHYRTTRDEYKNDDDDGLFNFYCDCFDQIHHEIFHLFSLGLRVKSTEINDTDYDKMDDNKADNVDFSCIDKVFEEKRSFIKMRRKETGLNLQRYTEKNNKFNLNVGYQSMTNYDGDDDNAEPIEGTTFLDEMFLFIQNNPNMDEKNMMTLKQYIYDNEYESDAIHIELDSFDENAATSNIYGYVKHVLCINLMKTFRRNIELCNTSFSTGYVWFYWDYYWEMIESEFEEMDNKYQYSKHNGCSVEELLISQFYDNLKEEILNSGFLSFKEWKEKIVMKGRCYYKTEKVKNITCNMNKAHGLSTHDQISLSNIYCIILYCDMTDLCTHFSATFRQKYEFEPLQILKKRHEKYYHFGKGLVEAVVDFGVAEEGTYYCGLSAILNVTSFAIYLHGPCSTSTDIEIAINFATRDGIIIQFETMHAELLHPAQFDCSWISKYSDENEELFIATDYRLKMRSIITIETAQDFEQFIHALWVFDEMISGEVTNDDVSASDVIILHILIKNELNVVLKQENEEQQEEFDPFIIDTFHLYLANKSEITLDIFDLDRHFKKISFLVMDSIARERYKWNILESRIPIINYNDNTDLSNVVNINFLSLFPNLKQVIVNTTYYELPENGTYYMYRFSVLSFLSAIELSKSSIQYVIKANPPYKYSESPSWLNNIITAQTKQICNANKWKIKFKREAGKSYCQLKVENQYSDYLIIET